LHIKSDYSSSTLTFTKLATATVIIHWCFSFEMKF